MKKYVLIVAGGKGLRMGKDLPKQFLPLKGKPILMHTIERFYQYDADIHLVLVLPKAHQAYWQSLCETYQFSIKHQLADGGDTRFHSVSNGLKCVHDEALVAIHDGVRPFVSVSVIQACFEKASQCGAVIPVLPMVDSLRRYTDEGSCSVDRANYCSVQTPQVFTSSVILKAYEQRYSPLFTDDASVVESAGEIVSLVSGNSENCKITTPFDLLLGEMLLSQPEYNL